MKAAAIFDMDGVLVDSEHLHWQAEQETMANLGVEITVEQLKKYAGTRAEVMFEDFIHQYRLPYTFQDIYPEHENRLQRLFEMQVLPTPGLTSVIDRLLSLNIALGVASSSSRRLIQTALAKVGLIHRFSVIVSGEEIARSKPAPDIFLEAARRLGKVPEVCAVFEDSVLGVQAARAAGMFCVGYENPASTSARLLAANLIIKDWSELEIEAIFNNC